MRRTWGATPDERRTAPDHPQRDGRPVRDQAEDESGEIDIDDALFSQYADDAVLVLHDEDGNLLGRPPLSKEDIVEVLRSAL